jgi:hypothetical protein
MPTCPIVNRHPKSGFAAVLSMLKIPFRRQRLRLKELIKYNGYQVAPAELEALLLGHPDVLDAAIVPIAHPTAGEAPKAYVVGRRFIDPQQLLIAARVAPHKRVHAVEFIERIPKSPSGKILRRELRSQPMAQSCGADARGGCPRRASGTSAVEGGEVRTHHVRRNSGARMNYHEEFGGQIR